MKAFERLLAYRPSPSMIVALVALFVAMGGTTYAVTKLPARSVGTSQLKANAVRTAKIKGRNVTRSRIARNAIDTTLVSPNALTGADIRESTLGTVKSAEKAATAGDAATVGGRTVQRFSFNAPEGTGPTLVLNTGGLALTARCDAGPAQSVTATSAVDNAIIHVHAAQSVGASTYKANDDFDVGDMFDPLPASGGTNAIGQIVYVRQDGGTVTAEYLAQETPAGCVFGGTAIS